MVSIGTCGWDKPQCALTIRFSPLVAFTITFQRGEATLNILAVGIRTWAPHHYDIAQWALEMDESGPVEIIAPKDPNAKKGVKYLYENGIEMIHGGPSGCVFHGENGTLRIDRGVLKSDPVELVETPLGDNEQRLPVSPGHHRDWLDCIKSRNPPVAEVEKGARTATIIHLGNLAYWHKRSFKWDPKNWSFVDKADNQYLDRQRRDPWQLPTV